MAIVEDRTPQIQDSNQNQNQNKSPMKNAEEIIAGSQASCCPSKDDISPKKPLTPKDSLIAVATKIAAQNLPCSDPDVWGVLTAISTNARKRSQGINILLTADEHCIGRVVDDVRFQIDSNAISQRHCAISRKRVPKEDVENPSGFCYGVFLKDTSTNGTYLNWERLKRGSSKFEAKLRHGDIISLAAPPQHDQSFAFVYREVVSSLSSSDGAALKRKAEEYSPGNKRLKGIGIGAPEGPVSLDDFRSLQHSNTELRKQLESHVLEIDGLRNENREALERHQNEIKELRESVSKSFNDQLNELNESLEMTKKELTEVNKVSAERKHAIEDLNERLSAALQSYTEANEIVKSQKASVAELKTRLDEERDQRREEREKAAADLKASIQRIQSEAEEEIKRVSDVASRREREQQEVISKLQESERENSSLVESLRSRLEETRQKLVLSENRVRQLEAQVSDEQQSSASRRKRVEELEIEMRRMRRELDKEKASTIWQDEKFWIQVMMPSLEEKDVFCYTRCNKCGRSCNDKLGTKFVCSSCHNQDAVAVARALVNIMVSDKTGSMKITASTSEVELMIGMNIDAITSLKKSFGMLIEFLIEQCPEWEDGRMAVRSLLTILRFGYYDYAEKIQAARLFVGCPCNHWVFCIHSTSGSG